MRTFLQNPKTSQQTTSAMSTIPSRAHIGQSPKVNSLLHLQRTIGNQAVQRMLQTDGQEPEAGVTELAAPRFGHDFSRTPIHPPSAEAIQTKLAINKLGDSFEQEADSVSEQVMRTPESQLQRACPCGGGCPKYQSEQPGREHEGLQTKRVQASDTGQVAAPPIVHEVLRSPGQPLDPATRAFMEPRFGYDFSRVRVHLGGAAATSARDVNAQAYTVGQHIVFGAGRFAPEALEGQRLIAHELTHVVQQSGIQGNRMGERARSRGLPHLCPTSDVRLQRGPSDPKSSTGQVLILGRSDATPKNDDVVLYHYGDLEARRERDVKTESGAPFRSAPGYPRLTNCDTATCQVEVTQHTGTPQNVKLRYKYEVRIDGTYFDKHFRDMGTKGAHSEYGSREPIPMQYFRRVAEIAPTSSAPPRLPPISGETTAPQRGSATTSGGTTKGVTTATGEFDVSNEKPGPGGGGFGSTRAAIGWGLAEFVVLRLLNLIIGPKIEEQQERQVALAWAENRPKVQAELIRRQGEIEELLRKTGMKKTIYANVSVDMIVIQACYEGGCASGFYRLEYVPPVGISTDDIDRRDRFSSIDPAPAGNIIHYPVTFSFAVAEPAALVLRDVWVIHQSLLSVRTKLKAASGGTAGEGVALDYLEVALRASDTAGANEFRNKPGPERYRAMISAMNSCLDFLEGAAKSNPAVEDPLGLLRGMRNLSEYGLGERWAIMVEAPGH